MKTLVILVSLGTPHQPTPFGVARFLSSFLTDPRVIQFPFYLRPFWWLLLHAVIIPLRIFKVSNWYRKIWTKEGSPLLVKTEELANALQHYMQNLLESRLQDLNPLESKSQKFISEESESQELISQELKSQETESQQSLSILYAMTYSYPKLSTLIKKLTSEKFNEIKRLIILPLFPLYSNTTTAAIFDSVVKALQKQKRLPEFYFIDEYASHVSYRAALRNCILEFWDKSGRGEKLLFSFHGIPLSHVRRGDPYYHQCIKLANSVAELLGIPEKDWAIGFQSRFGFNPWVGPDLETVLLNWAEQGVQSVDVVSPSFAIDCLETLEEVGHRYQDYFLKLGGGRLRLIPALNDNPHHVVVLGSLIENFL